MKSTSSVTRIIGMFVAVSAAIAGMGLTLHTLAQEKASGTRERVGVYDSRAVTVAYAGSAFQEKKMKELRRQHAKAKEAGDAKEVSRLEAEGKAWQAALNKQGFGTAPVDDILAHITEELPKIKAAAGLTTLVSKWNKPELDKHPKAEQVDVTMRLVEAFHPNERQLKAALEIQKQKPVTIIGD